MTNSQVTDTKPVSTTDEAAEETHRSIEDVRAEALASRTQRLQGRRNTPEKGGTIVLIAAAALHGSARVVAS